MKPESLLIAAGTFLLFALASGMLVMLGLFMGPLIAP